MGLSTLRRRRLLVRAGGDQDRRQPDPADRLRAAAPAAARPDAARPAAALRRRPLPDRADDLPQVVLPPARQRLRAALAADPDRRRRRRGLHRLALAQQDPAGDRRRGAADRGRLRLHAADRGRPGGLADRASSPTPATWCPGLVLAMALLPIARPLRAPDRRAWQTLLFLTAVYAITVLTTPRWYPGYIVGTIFLTLALVWAPAGLGAGARRGRASAAAVVAAARRRGPAAGGRARPRPGGPVRRPPLHELDPFLQDGGPKEAYDFARRQHDKRIGIAGSGEIFFGQYGFYGADLDNHVQYIGVPGPQRRLPPGRPAARQFRRRINAGDYDYLIISQYTQDSPDAAPYWYPIYAWVKNDPALKLVIEEPTITPEPDYVFKVKGKLDPAGCASSAPGSAAGAAQTGARACSRISSAERCGCSHQNMWPTPSSGLEAGAGISEAISAPLAIAEQPVGGAVDDQRRQVEIWPRRSLVSWAAQAASAAGSTGSRRRQRRAHLAEGGEARARRRGSRGRG